MLQLILHTFSLPLKANVSNERLFFRFPEMCHLFGQVFGALAHVILAPLSLSTFDIT